MLVNIFTGIYPLFICVESVPLSEVMDVREIFCDDHEIDYRWQGTDTHRTDGTDCQAGNDN